MFIALAALVHTQVSKRFSSRYQYSSHLTGQNSIRLLRLMPNKDDTAVIECQLFLYFLEPSKGTHLYEALSYVWGDPNHAVPILIGGRRHYVTENLHEALQRLRDDSLERTLWIDAICINQADEKEKERQIQLMERIYGQASRVIVWLGVAADSSDRALEDLRVIAADKSTSLLTKEMSHAPLLALLQRAWFQRIWVRKLLWLHLQESLKKNIVPGPPGSCHGPTCSGHVWPCRDKRVHLLRRSEQVGVLTRSPRTAEPDPLCDLPDQRGHLSAPKNDRSVYGCVSR